MKSSESSESSIEYLTPDYSGSIFTIQSPFYALLSIFIPVSIFSCLLPSLDFLIGMLAPVPGTFWFFSALVSAITASLYWAAIKKNKADHTEANVRGVILVVIGIYLFCSLFRFGVPFWARFFPSLHNVPSAIIALIVWFPVLKIKKVFEGQELFVSYTRIYEGEKLRQVMLQDSGIMSEVNSSLERMTKYYRGFFILPFALLLVCSYVDMVISPLLIAFFAIYFLAGISIIAFLSFLRREYAFAAEGLVFRYRSKALMTGIIVILSSAFLGLLFSSNRSLLPFEIIMSLIRRFLAFLSRFFTFDPEVAFPPEIPMEQPSMNSGIPDELREMMAQSEPSPFWGYLKYVGIGLVAVFFIWFMINPLLKQSGMFKGMNTLHKRLFSNLVKWLKSFALGFKEFVHSLKQGTGGRKLVDSEALRRIEDDILEGYSAAKKRDLRRSISLFARLIYWGQETLKITWKPSYAPLEYCRLLAACTESADVPAADIKASVQATAQADSAVSADILRAGELFEKALYSASPLSHKERDEFKDLVERITDSNR